MKPSPPLYQLTKLILSLLFILYSGLAIAQIDSLKRELSKASNAELKAEIAYELSLAYSDSNTSESVRYAELCLEQAKSVKSHEWTTTGYHRLSLAYFKSKRSEDAVNIYEEALDYELNVQPTDLEKLAWVHHNYANCYKRIGNYKVAKTHFIKSLVLEEQLNNKKNQASCLLNLGAMHHHLGDVDSSMMVLKRAYDVAISINDTNTLRSIISNQALGYEVKGEYKKAISMHQEALLYEKPQSVGEAMSLANMGNTHYYMGQIDSTIHYYRRALEIFELTGSQNELAMLSLNMGVLLSSQENWKEAIKNNLRAIQAFEEIGNIHHLSTAYLNLGSVYEQSKQYEDAMVNFEKALELATESGNKQNMAIALQNIGIMQEMKGNYPTALQNHQKCLQLAQEMDDKKLIAETHVTIGALYGKQHAYQKAEASIIAGLEIAEQLGSLETMEKAYGHLLEAILLGSGNQRAYGYYKKHLEASDSLKSARNHEAVEQLMTKYKVREKEDSIKLQQAEIVRQDLINEKNVSIAKEKNAQLSIALMGLIAATALGLLAFYNFRRKQSANRELVKQNEIIERKNKEKELLLGEIHHRVKNNLQMVSSLLNLQQRDVKDLEAKKAITEGSGRVKSMALVHNMLYRDDQFSGIDIDAYTERLINEVIMNLHPDGRIHLKTQLDPLKLDVDTAVPIGLILNELLTNTLKYAFDNIDEPSISVNIKMQDQDLIVNYSDNGSIKSDILNKIEEAESFGLRMINALTEQLKGKKVMTIDNGLHYTFTFNNIKAH